MNLKAIFSRMFGDRKDPKYDEVVNELHIAIDENKVLREQLGGVKNMEHVTDSVVDQLRKRIDSRFTLTRFEHDLVTKSWLAMLDYPLSDFVLSCTIEIKHKRMLAPLPDVIDHIEEEVMEANTKLAAFADEFQAEEERAHAWYTR